jgi:hypothetical protein
MMYFGSRGATAGGNRSPREGIKRTERKKKKKKSKKKKRKKKKEKMKVKNDLG